MTMRARFYELLTDALEDDPRVAAVLADIGAGALPRHERIFNLGIREQLMIGVAAGLALEGYRPVAHSYAPFLVERPYEQVKLDLGHQELGAVLVSTGASYDAAHEGRTHQAPADVALLAALPGWTIHVPGHNDELERAFRAALRGDDRVYIRTDRRDERPARRRRRPRRAASGRGPLVVAVGPTLDPVLAATADLDATVAYSRRSAPSTRSASAAPSRAPTSSSSSRIRRARRRPPSRTRSPTGRSGCSPSASAMSSCAATAPAPSTAPRTASTRRASAAPSTAGCRRCRSPPSSADAQLAADDRPAGHYAAHERVLARLERLRALPEHDRRVVPAAARELRLDHPALVPVPVVANDHRIGRAGAHVDVHVHRLARDRRDVIGIEPGPAARLERGRRRRGKRRYAERKRHEPQRVCGNPRSTFDVAGSGQREVTTLPRV